MQAIAGRVLGGLDEERLRVGPEQRREPGPTLERGLEPQCRDPQRFTIELRHQVERRAVGAQEDRQADHPLVAHGRHLRAETLRHQGHDRDHAAEREVRGIDRLAGAANRVPTRHRDQLEPGPQKARLLVGQGRQEVV